MIYLELYFGSGGINMNACYPISTGVVLLLIFSPCLFPLDVQLSAKSPQASADAAEQGTCFPPMQSHAVSYLFGI